jgi:hypothetical protein
MKENFTILQLYDGRLFNECGIYDSSIILVKGLIMPHEISIFDAYMRSEYVNAREKLRTQTVAINYLKKCGWEAENLPVMVIDYSSERSE